MMSVAIHNGANPSTYFGRQMRKERTARGWSLREFSARSGIDFSQASRVENGKQPPTERVARACDRVFSERRGWFVEYYEESKSWVPAGFRNWAEYEEKALTIRTWTPSFFDGLLQTEKYARAQLETSTAAAPEIVAARLNARMTRQQRVLFRDEPPLSWIVVDEMALYRRVGSDEVMAAQCAHLAEVATLPHVTLQVLPAVAHPAGASSFMLADGAGYAEHVVGGFVYTDEPTVTVMLRLFTSIQSESDKASESLAMIERLAAVWTAGGQVRIPTPTAGSA